MIAAGVPLPLIVGWAPSTLAKMAARYGHWGTEELRGAVEALIAPPTANFEAWYPNFPPNFEVDNGSGRAN